MRIEITRAPIEPAERAAGRYDLDRGALEAAARLALAVRDRVDVLALWRRANVGFDPKLVPYWYE